MSEISLSHLFLLDLEQHPYVLLDVSESKADLDTIHEQVKQQIAEGDWDSIQGQLLEHIEELLDVPLSSILVSGWNKMREIRQVIKKQKESGSPAAEVIKLFDHKLKSVHNPKLQVFINQKLIKTLPLSIELQLKLSAIELEIKAGAIRKIMTGQCAGEGTISYLGAKLHHQKFLKFSLPGKIMIKSFADEKVKVIDLGVTEKTITEVPIKPQSKSWILTILLGLILIVAALFFWWFI